jgi:hypothetical protein
MILRHNKGEVYLTNTGVELRNLLDLYWDRYLKLCKEKKECLDDEEKITIEVLQRQCRMMMAELLHTMKRLNVLDEEEIDMGAVKNK